MGDSNKKFDFRIFDTDYDNYQISYFCKPGYWRYFHYEWFSVYARTPEISTTALIAAKDAVLRKVPQYNLDNPANGLFWTK